MTRLKWNVATVDHAQIFWRRLPWVGGLAKIHRPLTLPNPKKLLDFLQSHGVKRLVVEPAFDQNIQTLSTWKKELSSVTFVTSPFLPTKTIHVDLKPSTEKIFSSFSEAKRRGTRRAIKLGVTVSESKDITALIKVKNISAGWFGFVTTTGIKELWETFTPKHAAILLAHTTHSSIPVGGVLLLLYDQVAYYWIAGATREGKKVFAPTLLAWEAIQLAKKRGAKIFDFVGVWDERIPKENTSWKGFTKFKEGFGGKTLYYPLISTS
jgi:lipid II:glycine glycyltransferase (peptidoglycan interpeptide bridge formation enzyme)